MHTSYSKPGSALLIILLILSGVSVMLLGIARTVTDNSRVGSVNDNANIAYQAALSGIEEGRVRMSQLAAGEEYGSTATSAGPSDYRLLSYLRSFTGQACDTLSFQPATKLSSDCPNYAVAVRRKVRISITDSPFIFTPKSLPKGVTVNFLLPSNHPQFSLSIPSQYSSNIDYALPRSFGTLARGDWLAIPSDVNSISLRNMTPTQTTVNDPLLQITDVSGDIVIDKAYTTIDSTGYAGGVERKLLLSIYKDAAGTKVNELQNSSASFNYAGLVQ